MLWCAEWSIYENTIQSKALALGTRDDIRRDGISNEGMVNKVNAVDKQNRSDA